MTAPLELANHAAAALRQSLGIDSVELGLVLGSGWATEAATLGTLVGRVQLGELPGFAPPTAAGHGSEALVLRVQNHQVLVYTGRTHFYEGRGVDAVAHGVRTAAALGAHTMVLTNACGGLRREWKPGTVACLSDHINLTGATPLSGANFVDMTDTYTPRLRTIAHEVDPSLTEGVYAQFAGPQYETPAEVRMAGVLGADLVGMSTALEAIAARGAGMQVLGLSLITNFAAGVATGELNHSEVLAAGLAAAPHLSQLLRSIVARILEGETNE